LTAPTRLAKQICDISSRRTSRVVGKCAAVDKHAAFAFEQITIADT
jgi:hypothetical protein